MERRSRQFAIAALAVSGAVLAWRAIGGPFRLFSIPVNSPMNAEGVFALSTAILLLLNSRSGSPSGGNPRRSGAWLGAIVLLTSVVLAPALRFPLVFDDYTLASYGEGVNRAMARYYFTQPGGDGFYRPIGYLSLGIDALWAHHAPLGWHLLSLALHLANIVLVYLLARALLESGAAALLTAVLFGLHGTALLTATFLAARFDVLSVFFVLAGLVLFHRYLSRGDRLALVASFLCAVLGFLTKEVAFAFPLLALLVCRPRLRAHWRVLAGYFAAAAVVFCYRWWLLKGIGGYRDPVTGLPDILHVNLLEYLKGFGLRIGAIFDFPLNWRHAPEPWLALTLLACLAALGWTALRSRASRPKLLLTLSFTVAALLPVAHLLLVDASLLGAWRFYLASAGFAMFLATAVQGLDKPARVTVAAALIIFQVAALHHNLTIWSGVAALADHTCAGAAQQASLPPVSTLPAQIDGVPFLRNGFEPCVAFHRVSRGTVVPAAR